MSSDTQLWGPDTMTQDLGADQASFALPPYDPGPTYDPGPPYDPGQAHDNDVSANNQTIFGPAVPNPYGAAHNNMHNPQEPNGHGFALNSNMLDGSVQPSLLGGNEPSTEATSGPVTSGSTIGVAPTPFRDPRVQSYSWVHPFPQTLNAPETRPQTIEPHGLNYPRNMPPGTPWQTQLLPVPVAPSPRCPYATGLRFSYSPQPPTQPINPTPFSQTGVSGQSLASFHPESAIMQTPLRANSLFNVNTPTYAPEYSGVNQRTRGWSSTGTSSAFSSARDRGPAVTLFGPSFFNPPLPSWTPGAHHYRPRRSRNRHGPAQRFDATGVSSNHHVSRHALPKGLDDPLDKRPEPKETAEMTVNMECKVCMSQPVDTAVFPCGHAMFCRWCAEKCMPSPRHDRGRVKESSRCPVCRCVVRQKMRIFLP